MPKPSENNLHELWGKDCGYNEGTICLVKTSELLPRGWFFECGSMNGCH